MIGTLFVVCYSIPVVMAIVSPIFVAFIIIQKYYMALSRQLKRMVSTSTSFITSSLTESYNGATTIRAFHLENSFIEENDQKIGTVQKFTYSEYVTNVWLFSRLALLSSMVIYLSY